MTNVTVWYDGACPLCVREIGFLRRLDRRGRLVFVDVAPPDAAPSCPIDRGELLARFHAQEAGNPVVSGAAAFATVYRQIPALAPLGYLLAIPPIRWLADRAYRQFLKIRPRLQRWAS
ncbi:MAG: DUF393 domain-containing protein [Pseudomonadota bacterium]